MELGQASLFQQRLTIVIFVRRSGNTYEESPINDDKLINDDLARFVQAQIPLTILNPELTYCLIDGYLYT